jgi:hypothetical protein
MTKGSDLAKAGKQHGKKNRIKNKYKQKTDREKSKINVKTKPS